MKHKIRLKEWADYSCPCCEDSGTYLFINGELITDYFQGTKEDIRILLEAFDIEYEFEDEQNQSIHSEEL